MFTGVRSTSVGRGRRCKWRERTDSSQWTSVSGYSVAATLFPCPIVSPCSPCSVHSTLPLSLSQPIKYFNLLSAASVHTLMINWCNCRSWFTKAEQLRQRQEMLIANRPQTVKANPLPHRPTGVVEEQQQTDTESDEDELDFDALTNWRAKVS